jgi:methylase of polypeptide subunit release factors
VAIQNTMVNARINNLKIKTLTGDFYKTGIKHRSDFIVCNPPYVNIKSLNKKMTKYESKISFNNGDALFFYEQIINNYKKFVLNPDNFLIGFEIGYDLKEQLTNLLRKNNLLKYSKFYKDYSNFDRVLVIKK